MLARKAIVSLLFCAATAMAQPNGATVFRVIGAKLTADPAVYGGACPTVIKFHGSIDTSGPGVVKYIFERSDGAVDTNIKSITFTSAPFHMVIPDDTWTLGGAGMTYSGWERIKILSPNAGFLSNEAHFQIRCTGGNPPPPTGTPGTGYPGPATSTQPQPERKPDLVVIEFGAMWPQPPQCKAETPVYLFQVTVRNEGTVASPSSASLGNKALVQVMAKDKAGWGNGALLNALAPGGTQTVMIPVYYLTSDPGFMVTHAPHPFVAIADPLGLVAESNESNNTKGPINMAAPPACPKPNK